MAYEIEDTVLDMPEEITIDYTLPAETPEVLTKAAETASQMMTGELSASVKKEIATRAAESSALRGLGVGKSAGALTLRDLGVKSLEYQQAGVSLGIQAGAQQAEYLTATQELQQSAQVAQEELQQKQKALNIEYLKAKSSTDTSEAQVALAAAELESLNYYRRLQAENQLIVQNSQYAVDNLNSLMADAAKYFTSANATARSIQSTFGV